MLTAPERLVAFTILHQTYASHSSGNPFIRFIVNVRTISYSFLLDKYDELSWSKGRQ